MGSGIYAPHVPYTYMLHMQYWKRTGDAYLRNDAANRRADEKLNRQLSDTVSTISIIQKSVGTAYESDGLPVARS